jgi:hypothetical protein
LRARRGCIPRCEARFIPEWLVLGWLVKEREAYSRVLGRGSGSNSG